MSALPRLAAHPGGSPRAWYAVALALVAFDGVASAAVVRTPADEANPLLAALVGQVGVAAAMTLRVAVGALLLTALLALSRHRIAREALATAALVHAAVAAWHLLGPGLAA